jgi:hypothetical protein
VWCIQVLSAARFWKWLSEGRIKVGERDRGCFAKELDEITWEGADGRVENLLALKDGKASPAWEEARGKDASTLAVGGHWFAARSTQQGVGLLVFVPVREGAVVRPRPRWCDLASSNCGASTWAS